MLLDRKLTLTLNTAHWGWCRDDWGVTLIT